MYDSFWPEMMCLFQQDCPLFCFFLQSPWLSDDFTGVLNLFNMIFLIWDVEIPFFGVRLWIFCSSTVVASWFSNLLSAAETLRLVQRTLAKLGVDPGDRWPWKTPHGSNGTASGCVVFFWGWPFFQKKKKKARSKGFVFPWILGSGEIEWN